MLHCYATVDAESIPCFYKWCSPPMAPKTKKPHVTRLKKSSRIATNTRISRNFHSRMAQKKEKPM